MTDTVTNAMYGHTGVAGHGFPIFSRPCPLLASLMTLPSLVFMITDFTVAAATEHEINTQTTRPDDTRPRPHLCQGQSEDLTSLTFCSPFVVQEQQRVAVGPGNAHLIYIRQVSLRRGKCGHCIRVARRCYCSAAAAVDAAVLRQFTD